jgi:hypothetical protein
VRDRELSRCGGGGGRGGSAEVTDFFFTYPGGGRDGYFDVRSLRLVFLDVRNFSRFSYVPRFLNHHVLKPYY